MDISEEGFVGTPSAHSCLDRGGRWHGVTALTSVAKMLLQVFACVHSEG